MAVSNAAHSHKVRLTVAGVAVVSLLLVFASSTSSVKHADESGIVRIGDGAPFGHRRDGGRMEENSTAPDGSTTTSFGATTMMAATATAAPASTEPPATAADLDSGATEDAAAPKRPPRRVWNGRPPPFRAVPVDRPRRRPPPPPPPPPPAAPGEEVFEPIVNHDPRDDAPGYVPHRAKNVSIAEMVAIAVSYQDPLINESAKLERLATPAPPTTTTTTTTTTPPPTTEPPTTVLDNDAPPPPPPPPPPDPLANVPIMGGYVDGSQRTSYFAARLDAPEPPPAAFLSFGPNKRSKIAVVSAWSFDGHHRRSSEVSPAAIVNKVLFCRRHGYDLYLHDTEEILRRAGYPSRHPQWAKPLVVAQLLPHYEWVIWHDIDILYMNFSFSYEYYIDRWGSRPMIIGREAPTTDWYLNTAHYLVKRGVDGFALLHRMFTMPQGTWGANNDQGALQALYQSHHNAIGGASQLTAGSAIHVVSPLRLFGSFLFTGFYREDARFHYGDPDVHYTFCTSAGCNQAIGHMFMSSLALNGFDSKFVPKNVLYIPKYPPAVRAAGTFENTDFKGKKPKRAILVVTTGSFGHLAMTSLIDGVTLPVSTTTTTTTTTLPPTTTTTTAAIVEGAAVETLPPTPPPALPEVAPAPTPSLPPEVSNFAAATADSIEAVWQKLCTRRGYGFATGKPDVVVEWPYDPLIQPDNARLKAAMGWLPYHDWVLFVDPDVAPTAALIDGEGLDGIIDKLPPAAEFVLLYDPRSGGSVDVSAFLMKRSAWAMNFADSVYFLDFHEHRRVPPRSLAEGFAAVVQDLNATWDATLAGQPPAKNPRLAEHGFFDRLRDKGPLHLLPPSSVVQRLSKPGEMASKSSSGAFLQRVNMRQCGESEGTQKKCTEALFRLLP